MPEPKIITITAECPECGCEFDSDIAESILLEDPQDGGIDFECPDCDCEFAHAYTYDAAAGIVTLGEEIAGGFFSARYEEFEDADLDESDESDEEEGENDD